jgi:hypothetical protein
LINIVQHALPDSGLSFFDRTGAAADGENPRPAAVAGPFDLNVPAKGLLFEIAHLRMTRRAAQR